jgi:ABC-type proline/glycine betaine transport system substrate-binding protein
MGNLIIEIDLEGKSVEDAVEGWIQENEGTWREWGACAQ